mgnify:CR=1 FL=1
MTMQDRPDVEIAHDGFDDIVPDFRPVSPVAQKLIDVTVRMIDEQGEVAVRVQDVVAAAGVQVPVLYRHFGNREGLICAAHVQRLLDALRDELGTLTAAIAGVRSREEFVALLDAILVELRTPERLAIRTRRANVVGSTYGRPELGRAIGRLQFEAVRAIADVLAPAQVKGWIRAELDLVDFAGWFMGLNMGRVLGELAPDEYHLDQWDAMTRVAVFAVLFGDD